MRSQTSRTSTKQCDQRRNIDHRIAVTMMTLRTGDPQTQAITEDSNNLNLNTLDNLKHIELWCTRANEYIKIPAKYILKLDIEEIRTSMYISKDNPTVITKSAGEVYLEISNEMAGHCYNPTHVPYTSNPGFKTKFQRIAGLPDIEKLALVYTDGTADIIDLPYFNKVNSPYINTSEYLRYDEETGSLIIEFDSWLSKCTCCPDDPRIQ